MANEKIIFDTEVKVGSSVGSVKSLKAELRAVTNELATLEEGSQAFVQAAQRAGQLRDKIGDVKDTINAFNPEKKFQAIADSVGIAANGFAAMQGAMALFGNESEDLNKVMVKTQGAIALATGLNGLLGMGDALKNLRLTTYSAISGLSGMVTSVGGLSGALNALKTTLLTNPLFVLASVIVAIGVALKGFYDGLSSGVEIYKSSAKAVADLKKSYTSLIDEIKTLQIENDLANGKITQKDADLLKQKNNFKKDYLKILDDANTKESEIREQAAKERDDDGFKGTKNLLDKLGIETATTKAAKQSIESIEKQKQENIVALREKYKLVNSNIIIEETKNEIDAKLANQEKLKGIAEKKLAEQKRIDDWNKERQAGILKTEEGNREAQKTIDDIATFNAELQAKEDEKLAEDKRKRDASILLSEQERRASHIEDLNEIAKDEVLSAEERYAALDELNQKGLLSDKQTSDAKLAIAKAEKDAKLALLDSYAASLNTISGLVGKNTVEGKALAIASATISTYTAIAKTLEANAANTPLAIASAIAIGLTGFAAVKSIIDTPVPNTSGGGGGGGVAPTAPRIPQSVNGTMLNQNKPLTTTSVGGTVGKVIVVETDITNTQDKVKGIIRKATIK
jgi:hypothetical protein